MNDRAINEESFKSNSLKQVADFLFTLIVLYAFLGFITGHLELFNSAGVRLLTGKTWKIAAVVSLLLWVCFNVISACSSMLSSRSSSVFKLAFSPYAFVVGLCFVLVSDLVARRFTFYIGPGVRAEILLLGFFSYIVYRGVSLRKGTLVLDDIFSWPVLLFAQVILTLLFLQHSDGRLLFSDDHPSFLYRLQLLREHFPRIPFYNTDWNAGYSAREFFPSGVLNIFLLAAPLIYLVDISTPQGAVVYTYLIPYFFIFIVPWSIYAAARLLEVERPGALLGGLLALSPSLTYFEWFLKYGTIGFALSAGLAPLTVALCIKLAISDDLPKWWHVFALLAVSFCCVVWTASAFIFIPLVVYALVRARHTFAPVRKKLVLVFILLFIVLNGFWINTFVRESKVLEFVSHSTLPGTVQRQNSKTKEAVVDRKSPTVESHLFRHFLEALEEGRLELSRLFVKFNPLILIFFAPGLLLIQSKVVRRALGLIILWLIFIAAFGDRVKPQLELNRMIVPASFFMSILSGSAISNILSRLCGVGARGVRFRWLKLSIASMGGIIILGAVVVSPITAGAIYTNRSIERFIFAPDVVSNLSNAVAQYGGSGRTFFAGFILHELGAADYKSQDGGHVAPLALFSGKQMYASKFYHTSWSTVDPIPRQFRERGREGIEEFLNIINASAVITFKREWADYCASSSRYQQVFKEGRFRLFKRKTDSSGYFLKGSGELRESKEGFIVVPGAEEVVVKFRYLPGLKVNNKNVAEIFPVPVFEEELGGGKSRPVDYVGLRVKQDVVARRVPISIGYFARR